jgi:hypothetical protein
MMKYFLNLGFWDKLFFITIKPGLVILLFYFWFSRFKPKGLESDTTLILLSLFLVVVSIYYIEFRIGTIAKFFSVPDKQKLKDILWLASVDTDLAASHCRKNENVLFGAGPSKFPTEFVVTKIEGERLSVTIRPTAPFPFSLVGWYWQQSKIAHVLKKYGAYEA